MAVAIVACLLAPTALAQEQERGRAFERGKSAVRGGIGFMDGPDAFLANFEFEGFIRDEVAIGVGLQLGVDDDLVVVAPTLFSRFVFDLSRIEHDVLRRFEPFVQGGFGIAHMDAERRGRDRDGTDFLMNFGVGVDYPLNDAVGLGSRMLINVIPTEVLNQRVYFSWEMLSVRYRW
ncbi:MAG: porin family protein [bacterium]|nr:porin family protein [bacterium]